MPEVFQEGLGHPIRRKDVIHQPGGDRAARHVAELGRLRVLRDGQPAAAPDRPHPQGPVRAGPGKEDADRPLLPVFRQGAEEEVDGHPNAVLLDRLGQIEDSVADAQVLIGRNDVNAVGFNGHRILACTTFMRVCWARSSGSRLAWAGARCWMTTKAAPLSAGMAAKNALKASSEPADPPSRPPGCPKSCWRVERPPCPVWSAYATHLWYEVRLTVSSV